MRTSLPLRALAGTGLLLTLRTAAQAPCDSVTIHSVSYAPFTDTALVVVAQNTATQYFFSYPQFGVVNTAGDTLGREIMNFFGLSWSPQTHVVPLLPGEELPPTPFTGTLLLNFMDVDGGGLCTFPLDGGLCPTGPCTPLNVYLYSFGASEAFTASFPWSVTNSSGAVVGSGTMNIDADDQQQDFGELCLPPGDYTVHVSQDGNAGVQYMVGLSQGMELFTNHGPSATFLPGTSLTLPFSYYPACIAGTNGIADGVADAPVLALDGRTLRVASASGAALGPIAVFDTAGRSVVERKIGGASAVLDLNGLAPGAYVLRSLGRPGAWPAQRFILP